MVASTVTLLGNIATIQTLMYEPYVVMSYKELLTPFSAVYRIQLLPKVLIDKHYTDGS